MLTEKEKELIAIGASVAAGCQPCTEYHVKSARSAGACDRSLTLAVETALGVRDSATRAMDEWAGQCQGVRPQLDDGFRAAQLLAAFASEGPFGIGLAWAGVFGYRVTQQVDLHGVDSFQRSAVSESQTRPGAATVRER